REKKGPANTTSCGHASRNKGRRWRSVVTALGSITLRRSYRVCSLCREGQFPIDDVLGLDGSLTPRARRLVCLTGTQYSFDRAEQVLRELSGWSVDAETIRQCCHAEADNLSRNRSERLNTA